MDIAYQIKRKIRAFLKKTSLLDVYAKLIRLAPIAATRIWLARKRKDLLLYKTLPGIYDKYKTQPVDENKVIFIEARIGKLGNSFQYLYDELKNNYDFDIHVHFLKENYSSRGKFVKNLKELMKDMATAKYVFISEASLFVSCVDKRPETFITQLWHACGAFKRFGASTADYLFGPDAKEMARHPMYANCDLISVSSPEIIWAYAEAMSLQGHEETIQALGTSRTDIFFKSEYREMAFEKLYKLFPAAKGKKIILYAPTFRGKVKYAETPDCLDYELFRKHLGDEYVLITKHHPLIKDLPKIPEKLNGSFAYDATRSMTIEDLLFISDICISDYSSLIYEFSLFLRPMLFYAFDLEEYFDWRGFYYNYDELTPGPVCRENMELINWILHVDENFDQQAVKDFRDRFMSACDGHATERILQHAMGEEQLRKHRRA